MIGDDPQAYLADWGETVFIDDVQTTAIYSASTVVDPVGIGGQLGTDYRLMLPACDVPPRGDGDPVVDVPARVPVRYLAREVQPDGLGWVTLILAKHPQQP